MTIQKTTGFLGHGMSFKGIKGFSIRRPGRPVGSRAIDRGQADLFPVEKFLSSVGFPQTFKPSEHRPERSEDGAPEGGKSLYVPVTRKVVLKNEQNEGGE